jgi:hypothetical protein
LTIGQFDYLSINFVDHLLFGSTNCYLSIEILSRWRISYLNSGIDSYRVKKYYTKSPLKINCQITAFEFSTGTKNVK